MKQKTDSYLLVHYDGKDYACLEDEAGESVRIPKKWLPSEAELGAALTIVSVTDHSISSLSFEVSLDNDQPRKLNIGG